MNMFRVGDNVWVESSGQLVFPQPVAITNFVEHDDGTRWAFVEGSSSAVSVDGLTPASRVGTNATSIELVVFSKTGGPLTKRITLTADGKIASDGSACTMARGRAKRIRIGGIGELAALIEGLTSKQAIALGALRDELPDEVRIVTKAALADGRRQRRRRPNRRQLRLPARPARAGAVRLRHQGHAAARWRSSSTPPAASGRRWCP